MLIFSRNVDESFRVGDNVKLTVLSIRGKQVRIGIEAPVNIQVHREEIYRRIQHEKKLKEKSA